ncbi:MAG TPA: GNAT family N-acetyltransferase [Casimicrobiaceae bacterium]|nr:GNAT family N-acetyltransferase [Casimicrobiaceae bacterium]
MGDPSGIVIRPATAADADAIAHVRIDTWRTAYRGLVPDAYLDAMDVEQSVALWQRVLEADAPNARVFVADRAGEVIGFAAANRLAEPRHGLDAELSAVYVRREFQRVGIGRQLVLAAARAQRASGATGLIVWSISGNKPARAFYEALGGTVIVEQPFEWDGVPLTETGYAFADLDALIAACERFDGPQVDTVH